MPEEVRTLRLLDLGVSLTEIDDAAATRLDELLRLDEIRKAAVNAGSGGRVDREGERG
jgi:hypothetical protein